MTTESSPVPCEICGETDCRPAEGVCGIAGSRCECPDIIALRESDPEDPGAVPGGGVRDEIPDSPEAQFRHVASTTCASCDESMPYVDAVWRNGAPFHAGCIPAGTADGYLGFRVGPPHLRLYGKDRGDIPHCTPGCKLFSDGWDHHRSCPYVAWFVAQAATLTEPKSPDPAPPTSVLDREGLGRILYHHERVRTARLYGYAGLPWEDAHEVVREDFCRAAEAVATAAGLGSSLPSHLLDLAARCDAFAVDDDPDPDHLRWTLQQCAAEFRGLAPLPPVALAEVRTARDNLKRAINTGLFVNVSDAIQALDRILDPATVRGASSGDAPTDTGERPTARIGGIGRE